MKVEEMAERLRVHHSTVRRWLEAAAREYGVEILGLPPGQAEEARAT